MTFWAAMFTFVFSQNLILANYLGFSGLTRINSISLSNLLMNSLVFTLILVAYTLISYLINLGLTLLSLGFLTFYLVLLTGFGLAHLSGVLSTLSWGKNIFPGTRDFLFNSAFVGGVLLFLSQDVFLMGILGSSLGAGLGYGLARIVFWGLRLRWTREDLPKYFTGWPLTLVALGFAGLVFSGFSGFFEGSGGK